MYIPSGFNIELQTKAIFTVPSVGFFEQHNTYLSLKDGTPIESYIIEPNCHISSLDTSSSNPAKPFFTYLDHCAHNGFIWPMGSKQSVTVSLYTSSASRGEEPQKTSNKTFVLPQTINNHPGQICMTAIRQYDPVPFVNNDINYAYITYKDTKGRTGKVVVGLHVSDDGYSDWIITVSEDDIARGNKQNGKVTPLPPSTINLINYSSYSYDGGELGNVDQDNYILRLADNRTIVSYTLDSDCNQAGLQGTWSDTKPFYVAQGSTTQNGFIWPLSSKSYEDVVMWSELPTETSNGGLLSAGIFNIPVNTYPGCIFLTRMSASNNIWPVSDDLHLARISYVDVYGNEGTVVVGPNPDNYGNTIKILNEQEIEDIENSEKLKAAAAAAANAEVWSRNGDAELLHADIQTHEVPGLGSVVQDNYYLQLKSGKAITSYTLNAECYQSPLTNDVNNPARPFCTTPWNGNALNGFIWPLGAQQSVATSMFSGNGEFGYPLGTDDSVFSMSVNEKPGCICLTRLAVDSEAFVNEAYYNAYITYTDSDGNTGKVILGISPSNKTLSILDWTEVVASVANMTLTFPEQYGATVAQIYANGVNQVPVSYSLSVADSTNVSIPVTDAEVQAVSSLVNNGSNLDIRSASGWQYSDEPGDFVLAAYNTQSGASRVSTVYSAGGTLYVSCARRHKTALTLAYAVTINGKVYSTASDSAAYAPVILLDILAEAEIVYQYRGGHGPNASASNSDFDFTYVASKTNTSGVGLKATYWNYYISFKDGTPLTKAVIKPDNLAVPVYYSFFGSKWPLPWAIAEYGHYTHVENAYVWPLGEKQTVQVVACNNLNPPGPVSGEAWTITINEKGPGQLCLTEINFAMTWNTYRMATQSQNRYVELYDKWGNKGVIGLRHMNPEGKGDLEITNGYAATPTSEEVYSY